MPVLWIIACIRDVLVYWACANVGTGRLAMNSGVNNGN